AAAGIVEEKLFEPVLPVMTTSPPGTVAQPCARSCELRPRKLVLGCCWAVALASATVHAMATPARRPQGCRVVMSDPSYSLMPRRSPAESGSMRDPNPLSSSVREYRGSPPAPERASLRELCQSRT